MIDDAAVQAALEGPLIAAAGELPAVYRKSQTITEDPDGRTQHLRLLLIRTSEKKVSTALTIAAGMLQVEVWCPRSASVGIGAVDPGLILAGTVKNLYLPLDRHLSELVRVEAVEILTTMDSDDRLWTITPVQVDFRVEMIDGST
mgnify:FL=1